MSDTLAFFLIQALNGVQQGLLLFLVASGLTLVFGIMRIINLAHGSFYMLGAYSIYALTAWSGSLWLALLVAIPGAVAVGLVLEAVLFRPLYDRDHLYQVLLTYGLILALEELRSLTFGDDVHGVAIPAFLDFSIQLKGALSYPVYRLFMSAVCLAIAGGMWWLLRCTRLGIAIRAGSTNREMVQLLGIDIAWLYRAVFALGVALAGLAGMIAAPVTSVFPGMGNQILIVSFVVVVIGGIGSVKGAFLAALLIGLADTFGQVYLPQFAGMTIYVLMAAVLMWRPAGLFGRLGAI
jgi:branched-chain amino acid transport system permease protein